MLYENYERALVAYICIRRKLSIKIKKKYLKRCRKNHQENDIKFKI